MILSGLFIADSPGRGRGVFTSNKLVAGTILELSPVIVMSARERILLDQTLLRDYIFIWGTDASQCCMALGYLSVYNHSYQSNAEYEMDFESSTIRVKAVRNIEKGAEVFINYNGDWNDAKPVWFDAGSGVK
jgi:SET domain-containing protein